MEGRGAENQEVCVAFSPFERIWLESKKRLPEYVSQKPANKAHLVGGPPKNVGIGRGSVERMALGLPELFSYKLFSRFLCQPDIIGSNSVQLLFAQVFQI